MSTGSSARGGKAAAAAGVEVRASATGGAAEILTPEALAFVATLQREFNPTREALLQRRAERQSALNAGGLPGFLSDTRQIREGPGTGAPLPPGLQERKVQVPGPVG